MKAFLLFLFSFTLLLSVSLEAKECSFDAPLKIFKPQFAQHFKIEYFKDFKIIYSKNIKYILSDKNDICNSDLIKVKTPVKKVVMMSTTYLPSLELMDETKSLIAFQGKQYIVSSAFELDSIKEVPFKINPEEFLKTKADLIMGYESNLITPKHQSVFQLLKLPVVINRDYEETSPLARAEWIIFNASFYNKENIAQKVFNQISNSYAKLKAKNLKIKQRPKVLIGEIQNGFWVTSGGMSDQAQMLEDAGAEMLLKRNNSSAFQRISLEELRTIGMPVDFWLPQNRWKDPLDIQRAREKDSRYMLIIAKNIYNNNLNNNKFNFNDFWEMGMQRPDLLLKDLSAIFHPEQYPTHKLKWYRKI